MAQSTDSALSRQLTANWQGFARWWLAGLREAVPARWLGWAEAEAPPRLLLRQDGATIVCRLNSVAGTIESRLPIADFGTGCLQHWLAQQGLSREEVMIGPAISSELFLLRELNVPRPALDALPRILDQDVIRRTPFALTDIWHAAGSVSGEAGEIARVHHWIIRRDRAEAELAKFNLKVTDVDFLAVAGEDGAAKQVISFLSGDDLDPSWATRAVRVLAVAALVVSVTGMVIFEWRQASVATALEASLAEARQGAQSGRDGSDPAGRLLALKADVSVLEVWEELSRILPDHTFLTESRIADGRVTISGYSADAARLVRIIDQSPLFSGATLTSAITPDATERKDRFSLGFKVRGARTAVSTASGRSAIP